MPDITNRLLLLQVETHSDEFRAMPATAQNLYFHFVLEAGIGGATDHLNSIMKAIGSTEDDLNTLIRSGFVDCMTTMSERGALRISRWTDSMFETIEE